MAGPFAFEVNGIDQRQPGAAINHSGFQQLDNFPVGFGLDPIVDRFARGFRVIHVINRRDGCAVVFAAQGEIVRQEGKTLLRPERIGHGDLDLAFLLHRIEVRLQRGKSRMQLVSAAG